MNTWWYEAFPAVPYTHHPPAQGRMLIVIAYDIADPKRLAKVAKACEDYGARVQYSVFECHLDPDTFETLWLTLLDLINPQEDRIVAYKLDARAARETLTAGTMVCTDRVVCYLV
ncbi:CRISPR-associated endonuclease Cas2 [Limisphaera ngatamarikiensis]|nr:CRISPR-associated endonuclease Cas2 [Limisphaera ngatamarikiensis]